MKKYWIVQDYLQDQIKTCALRPGDKIPPSRELQEMFGVSSITVRRAIAEMMDKDLLCAVQGSGTYVKRPRIAWRTTAGSFFNNIRSSASREFRPGDSTGIEIKDLHTEKNKRAARAFRVSPDTKFTKYVRVRTSDGEPVAVSISWLPTDVIGERDFFQLRRDKSLYKTLREKNIFPTTTQESFTVEMISKKEIYSLLNAQLNSMLLCGTRLNYDETGRLFEYTRNYLMADRYMIMCWDSASIRKGQELTDMPNMTGTETYNEI